MREREEEEPDMGREGEMGRMMGGRQHEGEKEDERVKEGDSGGEG